MKFLLFANHLYEQAHLRSKNFIRAALTQYETVINKKGSQ